MPPLRHETGYCTNVHAGADLPQTRANLERFALDVKRRVSPGAPMGVGLWLSAAAAKALQADGTTGEFRDWLRGVGLVPFTFNGFPYGDFHQKVVKHDVYLPTWADERRLAYTRDLIDVQHALLPAGMEGSISTLPIAWGHPQPADDVLREAGRNLVRAAEHLARLEKDTGRLIYLCLEPEPGCVLQRKGDFLWFFQTHVWPQGQEDVLRRYLRICHDVCHSVVMFEDQADVLQTYHAAGIAVGKVQVSSAVRVDFAQLDEPGRIEAIDQLAGFAEDRYLHQTVVREPGKETVFHQDLPALLRTIVDPGWLESEWRIHFHVPVYLEKFGQLSSSRDDIHACLAACKKYSAVHHFEVETYAWGVLPKELQHASLAEGIAQEMTWFHGQVIPPSTANPSSAPAAARSSN
jgi:sugar phosphate isomerase/epimerase